MPSKSIAQNSLFVFLARGIDTLGGILIILLTARYLVSQYTTAINGQFAVVVTLIGLTFTLSNAGLAQIIIRDVSRDKTLTHSYLRSAFILRVLFGILSALIVIGVSHFMTLDPVMRIGILIAVTSEMGTVVSWNYINLFNAYERMDYEAISSFIFRLLTLLFTVVCILLKLHWVYFFVAMAIGSFSRMAYVYWEGQKLVRNTTVQEKPVELYKHMKWIFLQALPIGFALLLTQGYLRIDILLLKFLVKGPQADTQVAYFFYPYRLLIEMNILPVPIIMALFPVMSRKSFTETKAIDVQGIKDLFLPAFKFFFIFSLPVMIFGYLYATPIMTTLFTDKFAPSGPCLQILVWSSFFVFVELLMEHVLIATGHQKVLFFSNGACLAVNFVVDFILIKYAQMGHIGASIGTVCAYTIIFIILTYYTSKIVPIREMLGQLPRPLLAGILCAGCFYFLRDYLWFLMIPLGFLVYIGLLFLIRTFSEKEIDFLKSIAGR